jgi:tetratricopeptide (TPR) repeat protein
MRASKVFRALIGVVVAVSFFVVQSSFAIQVSTPEEFEAYTLYNKGVFHEGQRNLTAAQDNYQAAIILLPGLLEAHNNLGGICSKIEDRVCALRHYTNLFQLSTAQGNIGMIAVAHNNLGLISMKGSNTVAGNKKSAASDPRLIQQALARFEQALALDNRYVEAWFNRGNALFALEDMNGVYLCIYVSVYLCIL